jgi:hypothetical protein
LQALQGNYVLMDKIRAAAGLQACLSYDGENSKLRVHYRSLCNDDCSVKE